MEFQQVLAQRYSCRKYSERPVEREKLIACMEAGRIAPSGCNAQPWMFIAVDDPEKREIIATALEAPPEIGINKFVHGVPAFIAVLHHPPRKVLNEKQSVILNTVDDYTGVNIGLAASQICLAATDMGLGSIMLGWFKQQPVKAALNIPPHIPVALMIGIGYPQEDTARRPSRYLPEQVYRFNGYAD